MRRKWLSSPEALDGIVGTLGAQALALRRMQDEPYQVCGLRWGGGGEGSQDLGETPWRWGVPPRSQGGGTCWGRRGGSWEWVWGSGAAGVGLLEVELGD